MGDWRRLNIILIKGKNLIEGDGDINSIFVGSRASFIVRLLGVQEES